MVGIIVTGHGSFATGLTSGLKLLVEEPEQYEAVDFDPEDSIEILTEKLEAAAARLKDCDGILILADLAGGSPFNVSIRLKMAADKEGTAMEVIGGTNLPVLLDSYMSRSIIADVGQLAEYSAVNGREQLIRYMMTAETDSADDEIEYDEIEYDE